MSEDVLKLSGSFEGKRGSFRLFNDRYLEVETGKGKNSHKYKVDLLSLAESKSTTLAMSMKWALLALVLGGVSAWMLRPWWPELSSGHISFEAVRADLLASAEVIRGAAATVRDLDSLLALFAHIGLLGPGVLLAIPALIALLVFLLGLRPVTRFKAFFSGVPLVSVPRPLFGRGAGEAARFVKLVQLRIAQCRRVFKVDPASQQAGEVKILRRLADAGVIARNRYESAKKKVFEL